MQQSHLLLSLNGLYLQRHFIKEYPRFTSDVWFQWIGRGSSNWVCAHWRHRSASASVSLSWVFDGCSKGSNGSNVVVFFSKERSNFWSVLEVIKLEFILGLIIKRNDWLLADTCPQAANHCALFWVWDCTQVLLPRGQIVQMRQDKARLFLLVDLRIFFSDLGSGKKALKMTNWLLIFRSPEQTVKLVR